MLRLATISSLYSASSQFFSSLIAPMVATIPRKGGIQNFFGAVSVFRYQFFGQVLQAENDNNTALAGTKTELENPFPHANTEEELEVECKDFMEMCTYVKVYFMV